MILLLNPQFYPALRSWPLHLHCFTGEWSTCQTWMRNFEGMKFGFVPDKFVRETVKEIPKNK